MFPGIRRGSIMREMILSKVIIDFQESATCNCCIIWLFYIFIKISLSIGFLDFFSIFFFVDLFSSLSVFMTLTARLFLKITSIYLYVCG